MVNRIDLTKRKDGYVISTVEPMLKSGDIIWGN